MQRELDRQTQERDLDKMARTAWLVDQVDNYVERWIGMAAGSEPTSAPIEDDLLCMIEIGAEAVSAELHGLDSPTIADGWRSFLSALAAIGTRSARSASVRLPELTMYLAAVRSALNPTATGSGDNA